MRTKIWLFALAAGCGAPAGGTPPADCAWAVQEIISAGGPLNTFAEAEALAANPGAATVLSYQSDVINRTDPQNPGGGGFFPGDVPFASDNATPSGLIDGDDNDFVLFARCEIVITSDGDYTFGFSSDDGARLRIEGATFLSSTRLNPDNPANPAHDGDMLSYAHVTGNSDTLGVCHLTAGTWELEFLTWERSGGAYAEVFAAAGAKTAMDGSFRLIGHRPTSNVGDDSRIASPGWRVSMRRNNVQNFDAALTQIYDAWAHGAPVRGLRFTSANDFADRDPVTFLLEGTRGSAATGPWAALASGNTGLTAARLTSGPAVNFPPGPPSFVSYRLTFPTIRNAAATDSMQIGEVQFLDGAGLDLTAPGDAVIPTSGNSPVNQTASMAVDDDVNTKYRNFDELNAGFTVTPQTLTYQVINFYDPNGGGGGHGFPQSAFPGDTGADDDFFAMGAHATLNITTPGDYTFCLLSNDGARFRIKGSTGWLVRSPNSEVTLPQALPDGMVLNGCCGDVLGTVNLEPGAYEVELIYNETAGGSYVGLWSAYGRHSAFSVVHFGLPGANTRTFGPDRVPFALTAPTGAAPPLNDNFANSFTVPGPAAHVAGCNSGATLQTNEPRGFLWEKTVWWKWTAPATGAVQLDTAGSELDTVLAVYAGNALNALTIVASNDDEVPLRTSKLTFLASAGTVYHFQVGGFGGETGPLYLNLGPPPAPPPPPPNDFFASATSLGSSTSLSVSGTTVKATGESGEPDHWVSNPANPRSSVWFTWTAPYTGDFIVNTEGSRFDTVLAVYTGSDVGSLTLAAADDQGPSPNDQSRLSLRATAGATYRIAVDGYAASSRGDYILSLFAVPLVLSTSVSTDGATLTFSTRWRSEPFTTYRIEQSLNLTAWTTVASSLASHGIETFFDIPGLDPATPRMFFRIWRE